jgi:ATP-dependent helicase/nuclease subunit A
VETLHRLRQALRVHSLTGLLEEIFLSTGMPELYGAMDGGSARQDNLEIFYQLAADFEAGGNRDLGRFLEHLDAMQAQGLITAGDQSAAGCVTIMSIHKSKGLEFPVVFLCGLGREFNTESQRSAVLCHKDMGLGMAAVDPQNRLRYPTIAKRAISARIGAESVSEELRVLYVAMTRARDRLIMTYASNRLQQDLSQIVRRLDAGGKDLLIRQAVCPGDWVLLTALQRTEAGELFALGGRPEIIESETEAWSIRVVQAKNADVSHSEQIQQASVPQNLVRKIQEGLAFRYAHSAATEAPGKQTATQRKGRIKDAEAAENTPAPVAKDRLWREASFAGSQPSGKDYGNAIHSLMQYIDYGACADEAGVRNEIQRLVAQQYITPQQAQWIAPGKIAAFFASDIGRKLRKGNVVREFKFSILEDGALYDPALEGERILLQGVVDCALIEEDGITVIDFKTDFVTEETLPSVVDRYRLQVEAYAGAMQRIYEMPVKKKLLYFFRLGKFVQL